MDIKEENRRQREQMRKNFKALRLERNWSIKELSEITGIGETILADIEGGRDFEIGYLIRLCALYKIKPHEIFKPLPPAGAREPDV